MLIHYFLGGPKIGEVFQKLFLRLGSYIYLNNGKSFEEGRWLFESPEGNVELSG